MGTSEDVLLKSVLHKLIIGLTDWTDDELQFYSNNHSSIEQKLELNDYPEDVFVTSANLSCVERSIITKELGFSHDDVANSAKSCEYVRNKSVDTGEMQ